MRLYGIEGWVKWHGSYESAYHDDDVMTIREIEMDQKPRLLLAVGIGQHTKTVDFLFHGQQVTPRFINSVWNAMENEDLPRLKVEQLGTPVKKIGMSRRWHTENKLYKKG